MKFSVIWWELAGPGRKLGNLGNIIRNHRNFFTTFSLPTFWFWPILKIENLVKKKTWKKNSEVSEVSNVSKFSICQFLDFLIKCPRFQIDSFFFKLCDSFVFISYFGEICYSMQLWAVIIQHANTCSKSHEWRAMCTIFIQSLKRSPKRCQ